MLVAASVAMGSTALGGTTPQRDTVSGTPSARDADRSVTVTTRETQKRETPSTPQQVICRVFGKHCGEALKVAHCESRFRTDARNGQYLGLFQMGDYARARYGHGAGAWAQARAAFKYFVDAGRDWSPWSCKPW